MNLYKVLFILLFFYTKTIFSIGTYAEGSVVAKILQFESRGIIFESYEGVMEITSFNKEEKCDEAKDECFQANKQKLDFSVRKENAELVNTLLKSINQEYLLEYKIHRIKAISLSSEFEILSASKQSSDLPKDIPNKLVVNKSGGKRNFSTSGKILQLDYQGTFIGTWEGIYLDETKNKIHPFSITSDDMAKYALNTMKSTNRYYMGISVAYVTGFRKSDFDLFEINYSEPAGGINAKIN